MAMTEEELVLVFFAFMVVLLTFPICRACTRPTLDFLESSVGTCYFPIVVFYSWMRHFSQRLWWIEPKKMFVMI